MTESLGIPLEDALYEMYENDFVIDWLDFIETGLVCNWTLTTIFRRMEDAFLGIDKLSDFHQIQNRYVALAKHTRASP